MSTSLELFVLAMVRQDLATPYELKTKAGLSLGSTVPVLARLQQDGLVKASEEGARRSRKFSITAKGNKVLEQGWAEQLKSTTPTSIRSSVAARRYQGLPTIEAFRRYVARLAGSLLPQPTGSLPEWVRSRTAMHIWRCIYVVADVLRCSSSRDGCCGTWRVVGPNHREDRKETRNGPAPNIPLTNVPRSVRLAQKAQQGI
jgi:DNA-binding PadR family transcriptional regulator